MSSVASIVETSRKDTPLGFDAMGSKACMCVSVLLEAMVGATMSKNGMLQFCKEMATFERVHVFFCGST